MEKPSPLDSPPPFASSADMVDAKAQLRCLGVLSNIEGTRHAKLPEFSDGKADVHARVCALEHLHRITPPPPMQEPDWDSLAWRIRRIAKRADKAGGTPVPRVTVDWQSSGNEKLTAGGDATLARVHDIVASVGPQNYAAWADAAKDPDADLSRTVQRLCFLAGAHRIRLEAVPTTVGELYAAAVEVALETEGPPAFSGPPPPPPGFPGAAGPNGPWPCRRPGCLCTCHHGRAPAPGPPFFPPPVGPRFPGRARRPSVSSASSSSSRSSSIVRRRKPSLARRVFGFGWLRPLACWRRKRVVDDSSSTYSSD